MNCNSDYQRAYNYVKKAQQNSLIQGCCCSTRQITGPTGPQGPATITVGTTTTALPGTPASVTNSGTLENVILDFTIPQGPTGPIPTLTAQATTVGSNEEAMATFTNTGEGTYQLDLEIPQGPTGPANGLNAFGGLYTSNPQVLTNLTEDTPTNIDVNTPMTLLNVTTTNTSNTLTIETPGTYEIKYEAVANITEGGEITLLVTQNNTPLPGTIQSITTEPATDTTITNSTITTLNNQDVLNLGIEANNLNGSIKYATLSVKKLD